MTPEALQKGKEIEKEINHLQDVLESIYIQVTTAYHIGEDLEEKLTELANEHIKSKLKARIEELEKELEAL